MEERFIEISDAGAVDVVVRDDGGTIWVSVDNSVCLRVSIKDPTQRPINIVDRRPPPNAVGG